MCICIICYFQDIFVHRYVNGEWVVSDMPKLNDGKWYHIAVTWESETGAWEIYMNGIKKEHGEGLATGTTIPGGGVLIIGQEQDCLGGCFSPDQEFIGKLINEVV